MSERNRFSFFKKIFFFTSSLSKIRIKRGFIVLVNIIALRILLTNELFVYCKMYWSIGDRIGDALCNMSGHENVVNNNF